MEFNTIYKNGKPERFFIKTDSPKEFDFIQPYFIVTDSDHTRKGNILEMNCLFSGSVWQGRQRHGYGYSASADVYGTLISIITELYKGKLSDTARISIHAPLAGRDKRAMKILGSRPDFNPRAPRGARQKL